MKETIFELGLAWTGMVFVLIVGSTYHIESSSPGEAKIAGFRGDKSILASKQDRENGDDRNGEKHVQKLIGDFFEESREQDE